MLKKKNIYLVDSVGNKIHNLTRITNYKGNVKTTIKINAISKSNNKLAQYGSLSTVSGYIIDHNFRSDSKEIQIVYVLRAGGKVKIRSGNLQSGSAWGHYSIDIFYWRCQLARSKLKKSLFGGLCIVKNDFIIRIKLASKVFRIFSLYL